MILHKTIGNVKWIGFISLNEPQHRCWVQRDQIVAFKSGNYRGLIWGVLICPGAEITVGHSIEEIEKALAEAEGDEQ